MTKSTTAATSSIYRIEALSTHGMLDQQDWIKATMSLTDQDQIRTRTEPVKPCWERECDFQARLNVIALYF